MMVEQNPGNIEAIATRATRICFLVLENSRGSPSTAGFQTNLERMRLLHFMRRPVSQKINEKKKKGRRIGNEPKMVYTQALHFARPR